MKCRLTGRFDARFAPPLSCRVPPLPLFRDIGSSIGPCRIPRRFQMRVEGFPGLKVTGKITGCSFPPQMPDTQGKENPVQSDRLPDLNCSEQVSRRGLAPPAFTVLELLHPPLPIAILEAENIHRFLDPAVSMKLFDLLGTKSFDIKRTPPRHEMLQFFNRLCRADQTAGTASHRIAFLAHGIRATFRTGAREIVTLRICGPFGQVNIGDLRDHIPPGAIDLNPVPPHANVLAIADFGPPLAVAPPLNIVLVVQGGVGHDDTADGHGGGEARDWGGQCARAAHLNVDCLQPGPGRFRGGELMRDGPAGGVVERNPPSRACSARSSTL